MVTAVTFGAVQVRQLSWDRDTFISVTRHHWRFSQWLVAATVVNQIRSQVVFVVTGALLGASTVGALRAARTLMGITHIVVMGLENA